MKKHFYGGQAVIEGVMIRGMKNCVVAVRNKNQEINVLTTVSKKTLVVGVARPSALEQN